MKKITAILFGVIMLASFAGCASSRFMKENELKTLPGKPKGNISLEVETSEGKQTFNLPFELFYDKAPITVTNFVSLANSGFYNDTYITQFNIDIKKSYINVLGNYYKDDESVLSTKELDYTIKGEFADNDWDKNDYSHIRHTLSMITGDGNDSAAAAFTILVDDNKDLDNKSAAFGTLTALDSALIATLKDEYVISIKILSITVDTYGVDLGEPLKIKVKSN